MNSILAKLYADEAFQKEYERVTGEKPELVNSSELEPLLKRFRNVPEEVKSVFREMMKE